MPEWPSGRQRPPICQFFLANNLNPFCCHRRHFLRAAIAKGKQQSADGRPRKRGCCMRAVPCPVSLGEGRGSDLACSTPEASLPSTSQSDTSSMPRPQLRNDCPGEPFHLSGCGPSKTDTPRVKSTDSEARLQASGPALHLSAVGCQQLIPSVWFCLPVCTTVSTTVPILRASCENSVSAGQEGTN